MKKHSVKLKITVLVTLLMAAVSVLLLMFMLLISRQVARHTAMAQLSETMRANLPGVGVQGGQLEIGGGFSFYKNGVHTLVYSKSGALIAGQLPGSFTVQEPFDSGLLRTVLAGEAEYFVLDMFVPEGWEGGVWLRGLMEAPDTGRTASTLLLVALLALPVFVLVAALGSRLIVKRAFAPLDGINATAAAINEAKDLSRRIGLPPGKDEFSTLAGNFDRLFGRLERSFEAEKQFTADASHELRTPVSIIKTACEYAEKYDETPGERAETLATIRRQAEKMAMLISQLLSLTRLEQGTEQIAMEPVLLAGLAREAAAEAKSGRLVLELAELPPVQGSPTLLLRLVRNLLENALKYSPPTGRVWLRVFERGGEALLQVQDEGVGIHPEEQERVWKRFYQADLARDNEEGGYGLGLAIVEQIAGLHGGYMTLESEPGKGSTFTLHLKPEGGGL